MAGCLEVEGSDEGLMGRSGRSDGKVLNPGTSASGVERVGPDPHLCSDSSRN